MCDGASGSTGAMEGAVLQNGSEREGGIAAALLDGLMLLWNSSRR